MKNLTLHLLTVLGILVLASCSRNQYVSENFDGKTASHSVIAVAPVEMIFTGRMPKDMTDEEIQAVLLQESEMFQHSFHTNILRSTRRGKRPMDVEMQSVRQTNSLLAEAGISIEDSWGMKATELAQILGVDAVITSKITKERFLSNAESYGISAGLQVLGAVTGTGVPYPRGITKTYDINVDLDAVDAQTGDVLFSNRKIVTINWSCTSDEAIERVNRQLTRRFPYSKKR